LNTTQIVLLTVLLMSVLATGWLLLNQGTITPRPDTAADAPDLFVENMDLRVTGKDGRVHYHLRADTMLHIPKDDRFDLERPVFRTLQGERDQWQVRSNHGSVSADGDTVWLRDQVEIRRLAGPKGRQLDITTSELLVRPEEQTAATDQAVVIQSDAYRVESMGMDADFGNNRLNLHSRVRGRIDGAG
jgi:lipopolysaccharide export system protein LptC